jgi:hypothetical protein
MRIQVGTLRGGPSASCPVFVSVALASSGWLSRGRSRGRSTQLTITPQVRRQIAGTRKAARLSRRATRPREIEQSERTCRPTAARPPYGRIDLLWRRGTRARGAACVCGVAGVLQPAALGRSAGSCRPSGSVPLRYWRAAALCTTGLFALRDWLMIHGSDPRHRPIRDCPRPPQDEGFLRQTVEMISVSRSEEDRFARPMGFPPTSRAR